MPQAQLSFVSFLPPRLTAGDIQVNRNWLTELNSLGQHFWRYTLITYKLTAFSSYYLYK